MERPLLIAVVLAHAVALASAGLKISIDEDKQMITYKPKSELTLLCNVSSPDTKYTVDWTRNGAPLTGTLKTRAKMTPPPTETRVSTTVATLVISGTTIDDAGNFSCVATPDKEDYGAAVASATFIVSSTVAVKLPTNVNVVEGERLTLTCLARGNPLPTIAWTIGNETYAESDGRVVLKDGSHEGKPITNGVLVIEGITEDDRGNYTCTGYDAAGNSDSSSCNVRVNGKYAALWPFLGICAEVIILCAIIVIYEKKRNKTELEESDTDQSPDQKNTPDHGKEANLRHRQ